MAKSKFTAKNIIDVAVADLIPYARNSRTHSADQVKQIAASIREFGFTNPVLIDAESTIIAGHGRVLAAQHLKLDTVPCIVLDHLTEIQRRAYVIADNKLALNAGWDDEFLQVELEDLHQSEFDIGLIGFSPDELNLIMNGWDSNIDIPEHGSSEDIAAIKIKVDPNDKDTATELIVAALEEHGIEYSI